ncbi:hypothetical protein KR222_007164 [Zaprionus bogoriensis]|nr:hypothetical protein KR222_007164 [Zaprionus bogoriensis]
MVSIVKPNIEEVLCKPKLPKNEFFVDPRSFCIFKAESFISRTQMNYGMQSILRSPNQTEAGLEQRKGSPSPSETENLEIDSNFSKSLLANNQYDSDRKAMYKLLPQLAVIVQKSSCFEFSSNPPPPPPSCEEGPIAMANGTIQLRLREGVRIDMTLDGAVRVLNQRSMVAVALSRNSTNSALIHPNGRILQSGLKVEIVTYDGMKNNNFVRYAKMWYKGVSFTSESCALVYLVDTAATRTTSDTFADLTEDCTLSVFYGDSRRGSCFVPEAKEVIANSLYNCAEDGTELYEINGFRIVQAPDGLVRVTRHYNKGLIRTSPANGSVALTTLGIHCTASLGKNSHLFVRRNEKRLHFDGSSFIVRNAGTSAGFNENNLLIVY